MRLKLFKAVLVATFLTSTIEMPQAFAEDLQKASKTTCGGKQAPTTKGWSKAYDECLDRMIPKNATLTADQSRAIGCSAYPHLKPEEKAQVLKTVVRSWSKTESADDPEFFYADNYINPSHGLVGISMQAPLIAACREKRDDPYLSLRCGTELLKKNIRDKKNISSHMPFLASPFGKKRFAENMRSLLPASCQRTEVKTSVAGLNPQARAKRAPASVKSARTESAFQRR